MIGAPAPAVCGGYESEFGAAFHVQFQIQFQMTCVVGCCDIEGDISRSTSGLGGVAVGLPKEGLSAGVPEGPSAVVPGVPPV
jgi:hypothetical protein